MATNPAEAKELRRDVNRDVIQAWLDALATGACDEQAFLDAVQKLARKSLEAGWDTLSLIDQYYRRGRLPLELFNRLKARLGSQLVGQSTAQETSVPMPVQDDASVDDSVPAPPPPRAPSSQTVRLPSPKVAPAARVSIDTWTAGESQPNASGRNLAVTLPGARDTKRRASRREINVGDLLRGRYQIKSVLGRGGTATVFEAVDLYRVEMPDGGQRVALKILHMQVSSRPDLLGELQREFQLLQSLSHPHIVRVHDYDRDGDIAFLTMEYLRGHSLLGLLSARDQAPLARAYSLAIIRDVGGALAHAHSKGVIHGDLNPGNIFVTNEGDVRVLDFGAAHPPSTGPVVSASESDHSPIATPRYASVQVLEGKRPDVRDDVYGLACIAYLLLTGKHPFGEKTALAAQEEKLKPSRPQGLAHKEWQALRRGLAFDRERRPSNIEEWLHAFDWNKAAGRLPVLLALVRVTPTERKRFLWPSIGIAAALLLAAGLWAGYGSRELPLLGTMLSNLGLSAATAPADDAPVAGNRHEAAAEQPSPPSSAARSAAGAPPSASPQAAAPGASSRKPTAGQATEASAPRAASGVGERSQTTSTRTPLATRLAPAAAPISSGAAAPGAAVRGAAVAAASAPSAATASDPDASGSATPIRSRIELAADTIEVPLTDPAARVIVRRKGNLHGNVTFTWWTESGTAKPGQDFMAVAPHPEVIEPGQSSASLFIPVVGDSTRRQPKSFYVVISDPSAGVALGARTLTMVTIPPSE